MLLIDKNPHLSAVRTALPSHGGVKTAQNLEVSHLTHCYADLYKSYRTLAFGKAALMENRAIYPDPGLSPFERHKGFWPKFMVQMFRVISAFVVVWVKTTANTDPTDRIDARLQLLQGIDCACAW